MDPCSSGAAPGQAALQNTLALLNMCSHRIAAPRKPLQERVCAGSGIAQPGGGVPAQRVQRPAALLALSQQMRCSNICSPWGGGGGTGGQLSRRRSLGHGSLATDHLQHRREAVRWTVTGAVCGSATGDNAASRHPKSPAQCSNTWPFAWWVYAAVEGWSMLAPVTRKQNGRFCWPRSPRSLLTCSMSLLDQVSSLTASYSAATRWQVNVLGFSRARPCNSSEYSLLPSNGLLLSKCPRLISPGLERPRLKVWKQGYRAPPG